MVACLFEVLCRQNRVEVLDCRNAMIRWNALSLFSGLLSGWFLGLGHWLLFWCLLLFNLLGSWLFCGLWLLSGLGLFNRFLFLCSFLSLLRLGFWLLLGHSLFLFNFRLFSFSLCGWNLNFFLELLFLDWRWFYFFSGFNKWFGFLNILNFCFLYLFNEFLFWFLFSKWLVVGLLVSGSGVCWSVVLASLVVTKVLSSFRKELLVVQVVLSSANDYFYNENLRSLSSKKLYFVLLTLVLTCLPTLIHLSSFFLVPSSSWSPFSLLAIMLSSLRKICSTE